MLLLRGMRTSIPNDHIDITLLVIMDNLYDHLHDHHMMRAVKTDGSGWEDSGRREMGAQMQ